MFSNQTKRLFNLLLTFYSSFLFEKLHFALILSKSINIRTQNQFLYQSSSFAMAASSPPSNSNTNDLQKNINFALGFHKNGLFDQAIAKYEEIIPLVSGILASTLHSNAGAIYMNNLGIQIHIYNNH